MKEEFRESEYMWYSIFEFETNSYKFYCFPDEEMWKSEEIVCWISVNVWILADYYSFWLKTANSRVKRISL